MPNERNPFERVTGSGSLGSPGSLLFLFGITGLSAVLISKMGIIGSALLIMLPFVVVYFNYFFRFPIIGLYTAVAFGYILLGIGRYAKGLQVGLAMDGILVLTFIALIFNKFYEGVNWKSVNKDITWLSVIWFGYSIFQLVNPEAHSVAAWFSGRGVSFYMLTLVPLTLLFIDSDRKLTVFLIIWGVFSALASMKGIMQQTIGVDPWERAWLDEGNAKTHILFGKLRSFSFLSDAGQFGGNQAYTAVVATIVSIAVKGWKSKLFFLLVALLGYYGMIISGTRGAISIPLSGFMAYFIYRKNIRVLLIGVFLLAIVFVFFKFTTIGQGNDQIRRMRTAFDPNDASLQVRLENQRKLKVYLASRPFGGGIGLGGVKAQKYLPNAFLSQVATDSWYVLIWVEQGIVGLLLHLFILFYTLIKGSYHIMFRIRDPILKLKMAALASGMFGVMVASYGNAVLGQMPTAITLYISMALLLNTEKLDWKSEGETVKPLDTFYPVNREI
jgi:hypothetical protein